MPRMRSPNRDKAFEIYRDHGGNIDNREIAEILSEKEKTISSWKCRDKWLARLDCSTTKNERSTTKRKKGAQPGNKTSTQFKPGNKTPTQFAPGAANPNYRHALFAKYMPKESLDIIMQIESASPLDLIWDQIMIAYTAIQRSQRIMYVSDINDKTIERIQEKDGMEVSEERWEVQQAWDKQANFLKAQARAQSELRSLVKQYKNMIDEHPELYTEEQRARIEKLKVEISKAKGENNQEELDKLDKVLSEIKGVI